MTVRRIALATILCGTLDIAYAAVAAVMRGGNVGDMLRSVASGPFGDAAKSWGAGGAVLGLGVHFAIMAVMAAVGLALLSREPLRSIAAWKTGTLYGIILYCVMYGLVLPMRFGMSFPNPDRMKLAIELIPHIALVGIPLAIMAGGSFVRRKPATS